MKENSWAKNNTLTITEKEEQYFVEQVLKIHNRLLEKSARSKSDLAQIFMNCRNTVIEHLLKLFYFRNFQDYRSGWVVTCYKYFNNIPKLKITNKWPKKEFVFEYLWNSEVSEFTLFHSNTINYFNNYLEDFPIIEGNERQAFEFCEDYLIWVSYEIEKKGGITLAEASIKIDELLDKYEVKWYE